MDETLQTMPLMGWQTATRPGSIVRIELRVWTGGQATPNAEGWTPLPVEMSALKADALAAGLRQGTGIPGWTLHALPDGALVMKAEHAPDRFHLISALADQVKELADALEQAAVAARMGPAPTTTRN